MTIDPYAWQRANTGSSTALPLLKCLYCGAPPHEGTCPRVKAMEYWQDGRVRRVEFWDNEKAH